MYFGGLGPFLYDFNIDISGHFDISVFDITGVDCRLQSMHVRDLGRKSFQITL